MIKTRNVGWTLQAAQHRLSFGIVLLAAVSAFSFGAIVRVAFADYHVTCVGHGFVHGDSTTDGSFFSRVESGCGGGTRVCDIFTYGGYRGGVSTAGSSTCNAWSFNYGSYTECAGSAHVEYGGAFSRHAHYATNWCG